MRRLLRPIWILLAILFLIEAWLWDHLEPIVARIVAVIPWQRLKALLARRIATLSPTATLLVFLVPVIVIVPFKVLGLWLVAEGYWVHAAGMLLLAKLAGLGTTAFVFDACREKLLQLVWFRLLYESLLALRDWAHSMVDPIMRKILGYYPDPTLAVSPTLQTNWSQNFPNITHTNKWFTRADQNFGSHNRLFFRYGFQTSPRVSHSTLYGRL